MSEIGKPSIYNFMKPRPKKMRVIGEWLQSLATTSAIGSFFADEKTTKYVTIALFAVGQIGSFITKFYGVDVEDPETPA